MLYGFSPQWVCPLKVGAVSLSSLYCPISLYVFQSTQKEADTQEALFLNLTFTSPFHDPSTTTKLPLAISQALLLLSCLCFSPSSSLGLECPPQFFSFKNQPKCHLQIMCVFVYVCVCVRARSVAQSCPTLRPPGLEPTRFLSPWHFPGKNTEAGCHFLVQGIFPTQGLKHCRLHFLSLEADSLPLSHLESPPGSYNDVYLSSSHEPPAQWWW